MVGQAAKRLAARAPDNTFYSVKRLIGRTFDDPVVQDEASRVAYKASGAVHADQHDATPACAVLRVLCSLRRCTVSCCLHRWARTSKGASYWNAAAWIAGLCTQKRCQPW